MKNIYEILKGIGIEIPAEKKDAFDTEWKENYRTKAEYEKAVEKRDEYKVSLENVQGELEGFKNVNIDDLKGQITTLTEQLQSEKEARAKDTARAELEKNVDSFLLGKKFVNAITQDALRKSLMDELDKDTAKGKSIADIFTALTTDENGKQIENILVDEKQQTLEQNKARFTEQLRGQGGSGGKFSMTELMKMANEGTDVSQYMNQEAN